MPTPVTTARQCLTEEAARALDDAVSVAKRRNHAQTTSLHAISALLSPSFSLLRESLTRARSSAYSPRLQFRALELCVGVSLDRVPSSKTQNDDFAPPISNSLMAAIKRSQANQRRQPDMYHLHQININNNNNSNNPISISNIKVELKHFVLSILDDPIVSRVLGEAGFRSSEIKMAIIHPPVTSPARWPPAARCPPLFLCNLMDYPAGDDENCRRIGEVMVKRREKNPILIGVCAKDALASFKDCLQNGRYMGFPREIHGLKLVCLEREIEGFVGMGRREKVGLDLEVKLKEIGAMVENNGVVVNLGELKVLVKDKSLSSSSDDGDEVNDLVMKLNGLVEVYGKNNKLWLIGAATDYETYSRFVGSFPSVERDWDLHPLPITNSSSRSSFGALSSKSSLMGSFVPFGGFFPTQSDFRSPFSGANQPFSRCSSCNEKFESELCAVLREGSSVSVADQCSPTLPSWLQRAESDTSKGRDFVGQVKDVKTSPNEHISRLQKKWDDHCRHLHQSPLLSAPGVSLPTAPIPHNLGFPFVSDNKQGRSNSCSSGESSLNEGACSNSSSGMRIVAQNISPRQSLSKIDCPKLPLEMSGCHPSSMRESSASLAYPIGSPSLPLDPKLPSPISVTTDLGLGTIYASKHEDPKNSFLQGHLRHFQNFPGSISPNLGMIKERDHGDYKTLFRKLSEVVTWQPEAISRISEIISCCRNGSTNARRNIWLSFLGFDKIGKKKVTEALADAIFASKDRLIAVDLSSEDIRSSKANSLFICQGSHNFDINLSRMTVVDHIAQELCKKPHSVVLLENIDEADPMVQHSLSRAIQTGKFQDSRGREISINNVVFVATSSVTKDQRNLSPRKEFIKFTQEKVLEAKNWEMQISVRSVSGGDASRNSSGIRVSLVSPKCCSNLGTSTKRKLEVEKEANKKPKNSLDLNLPLEEETVDERDSHEGEDFLGDASRAWVEDFLGQVDGNVEFKPFDFDALADKLLRKIRLSFEEKLKKGGESAVSLEIDYEVMVQILAAAWCSNKQGAVDNWIEEVLGSSFDEARERFRLSDECLVRLVSCEGAPVKEWASGICLPRRIDLSI